LDFLKENPVEVVLLGLLNNRLYQKNSQTRLPCTKILWTLRDLNP